MSGPVLLQVCNVGRVTGGTGACAWTITRALAGWRHIVAFPARSTTRRGGRSRRSRDHASADRRGACACVRCDGGAPAQHRSRARRGSAPAVTIQYVHSPGRRADADALVYCSRHLARLCGGEGTVLYQPVPAPPWTGAVDGRGRSRLGGELVVGRLCTPTEAKWPDVLVECYAEWSRVVPDAVWEFVGCPDRMRTGCCRLAAVVLGS